MHPELIHLGPLTIYTYGLMMAIAFLTGYYILKRDVTRLGEDPVLASDLTFWAAVGGIAGAKIFYLVENFSETLSDPIGTIFSGSGLVFQGGLIGGTLSVVFFLKMKHKSLGIYADIAGPVLLVGQGIGRIGCFFAGCCHGDVCHSSLGLVFPAESQPAIHQFSEGLLKTYHMPSLPTYPTQLFETIFNVIMFIVLVKWIRPRLKKRGSTFALFLLIQGTERFFLEFFRVNPKGLWGLTHYQFSSMFLMLLGTVLWVFFVKVPKTGKELEI